MLQGLLMSNGYCHDITQGNHLIVLIAWLSGMEDGEC